MLGLSWTLTTASIGPAFGRVGGRPGRRHADLGDDQLQVARRSSRGRTPRPRAILFSVSSIRVPLGGPDVDLERPGVDLGEELAAEARAEQRRATAASSRERRRRRRARRRRQHDVEQPDVAGDAGVDHRLPAREQAGRAAPSAAAFSCGLRCSSSAVCDSTGCGRAAAARRRSGPGRRSATGDRPTIIANATARAIGRNRNAPRPGISASGASTRSVQRLATSSGSATSLAPR